MKTSAEEKEVWSVCRGGKDGWKTVVKSNQRRGAICHAEYGLQDAYLIAAAPELLETLKENLDFITVAKEAFLDRGLKIMAEKSSDYIQSTEAAIQKAEGK